MATGIERANVDSCEFQRSHHTADPSHGYALRGEHWTRGGIPYPMIHPPSALVRRGSAGLALAQVHAKKLPAIYRLTTTSYGAKSRSTGMLSDLLLLRTYRVVDCYSITDYLRLHVDGPCISGPALGCSRVSRQISPDHDYLLLIVAVLSQNVVRYRLRLL
jgi:hypothetical protein